MQVDVYSHVTLVQISFYDKDQIPVIIDIDVTYINWALFSIHFMCRCI